MDAHYAMRGKITSEIYNNETQGSKLNRALGLQRPERSKGVHVTKGLKVSILDPIG